MIITPYKFEISYSDNIYDSIKAYDHNDIIGKYRLNAENYVTEKTIKVIKDVSQLYLTLENILHKNNFKMVYPLQENANNLGFARNFPKDNNKVVNNKVPNNFYRHTLSVEFTLQEMKLSIHKDILGNAIKDNINFAHIPNDVDSYIYITEINLNNIQQIMNIILRLDL